MPRGQKLCSNCGSTSGPRAFVCKNCNTQFSFKAKSREEKNTRLIKNFNWKELQKGDVIKVSGVHIFIIQESLLVWAIEGNLWWKILMRKALGLGE
jgi:uncharacterized membrane protein YvbJ